MRHVTGKEPDGIDAEPASAYTVVLMPGLNDGLALLGGAKIVWVPPTAADFQKRLGARVREIRTERAFSQESFAEARDLHRTHVSLLERGRINITINTARQIAHALQISLSELFRGLS